MKRTTIWMFGALALLGTLAPDVRAQGSASTNRPRFTPRFYNSTLNVNSSSEDLPEQPVTKEQLPSLQGEKTESLGGNPVVSEAAPMTLPVAATKSKKDTDDDKDGNWLTPAAGKEADKKAKTGWGWLADETRKAQTAKQSEDAKSDKENALNPGKGMQKKYDMADPMKADGRTLKDGLPNDRQASGPALKNNAFQPVDTSRSSSRDRIGTPEHAGMNLDGRGYSSAFPNNPLQAAPAGRWSSGFSPAEAQRSFSSRSGTVDLNLPGRSSGGGSISLPAVSRHSSAGYSGGAIAPLRSTVSQPAGIPASMRALESTGNGSTREPYSYQRSGSTPANNGSVWDKPSGFIFDSGTSRKP